MIDWAGFNVSTNTGYLADSFTGQKSDPTNSIKVLKEKRYKSKETQKKQTTQNTATQ